MSTRRTRDADDAAGTPARRRYEKPSLRHYGTIHELTRGGARSTVSDHGNNRMSPFN